jgi:hypothetical protein
MEPTINCRELSILAMYVTRTKLEIEFQTHLKTRTKPIYIVAILRFKYFLFFEEIFFNPFWENLK